jgi:hypothetical protein
LNINNNIKVRENMHDANEEMEAGKGGNMDCRQFATM